MKDTFKVKCSNMEFSLSGVQNKVQQYYDTTRSDPETAAFALRCVCSAVLQASEHAKKLYPGLPIVFSGGVASNSLLRADMADLAPVFCAPKYATDNAMGVAVLAHRLLEV